MDYPAACNAVEKVLVHESLAEDGRLFKLQTAMRDAGACVLNLKVHDVRTPDCSRSEATQVLTAQGARLFALYAKQ